MKLKEIKELYNLDDMDFKLCLKIGLIKKKSYNNYFVDEELNKNGAYTGDSDMIWDEGEYHLFKHKIQLIRDDVNLKNGIYGV
jgi:hypothetical protein